MKNLLTVVGVFVLVGCGGSLEEADEGDVNSQPDLLRAAQSNEDDPSVSEPSCEPHNRPGDPMGAMRAFIGQNVDAELGTNLFVLPQHISGPHVAACPGVEPVQYFKIPVVVNRLGRPDELTLLYMLADDVAFYLPQIQTYHFWWVMARHPDIKSARCDEVPEQLKCAENVLDEIFPTGIDPV